jgi:hypothetical protein
MAGAYPAPPGKDQPQVRTRLATLTLATLLTLPAWATSALADQGPGPGTASGSGSAHSLRSAAPGSGSERSGSDPGSGGPGSPGPRPDSGQSGPGPGGSGPGSGSGGSGRSGSGSGGPGSDDSRPAAGTSPHHANSSQHSDPRPGLRAGPDPASQASASATEAVPPVGSVADRWEGFPRLSTPPGLAAVAAVAGGALLFVALVAAGFRARARLGRLG